MEQHERTDDDAPAADGPHARLRTMLDRTAEVVVRTSADGVLLEVTPSVATLLDWRPVDLVGRPLREIVHPDDLDDVRVVEAELEAGRPQRFTVRLRHRDRTYRSVDVSLRPVVDDDGTVVGRLGGWRATRTGPSPHRADDPMLGFVVDHTREALVLVDPDGRVVWSTTAVRDLLAWGSTALLGRAVTELIHHDDFSAALPHLQAAFRLRDPVAPPKDLLARLVAPGGGYAWAAIRLVPLTDVEGDLVGVVFSARAVDELFTSREQLATERALWRASIDSMLDPHVVLVPLRDRRGEVADFVMTHANPAACANQGTDLGTLLGSRLSEIAPAMWPNGLFAMIVRAADTSTTVAHDGFVYTSDDPEQVERRYALIAVPSGGRVCVSWRQLPPA